MSDKKHILLVDDDKHILDLLEEMLTEFLNKNEYSIKALNSSSEAYKELSLNHYDILITDFRMPNVNGMQLVEKAIKVNKDIKTFMITGELHIDLPNSISSLRLFKKPVEMNVLIKEIKVA